jgi:hypothetical protein
MLKAKLAEAFKAEPNGMFLVSVDIDGEVNVFHPSVLFVGMSRFLGRDLRFECVIKCV